MDDLRLEASLLNVLHVSRNGASQCEVTVLRLGMDEELLPHRVWVWTKQMGVVGFVECAAAIARAGIRVWAEEVPATVCLRPSRTRRQLAGRTAELR